MLAQPTGRVGVAISGLCPWGVWWTKPGGMEKVQGHPLCLGIHQWFALESRIRPRAR